MNSNDQVLVENEVTTEDIEMDESTHEMDESTKKTEVTDEEIANNELYRDFAEKLGKVMKNKQLMEHYKKLLRIKQGPRHIKSKKPQRTKAKLARKAARKNK